MKPEQHAEMLYVIRRIVEGLDDMSDETWLRVRGLIGVDTLDKARAILRAVEGDK